MQKRFLSVINPQLVIRTGQEQEGGQTADIQPAEAEEFDI